MEDKIWTGEEDMTPAIPPVDYKGTIAGWITSLVTRGLYDDSTDEWYGDVIIPDDTWWEILEENEG